MSFIVILNINYIFYQVSDIFYFKNESQIIIKYT